MTRTLHRLLLVGGLAAAATSLPDGASAQTKAGFASYDNDKHGFSLIYPTSRFISLPMASPDGFQAVSRDGKARLLVGTISNFDGKSLAAYRKFLLDASYAGANIVYAPARETWFVVSGTRSDGTSAFYQRVNFVCGGRNINSWAVFFPAEEQPVYSKIIEQVHRDYVLGDGNCNKTVVTTPPAAKPKQMGAKEPAMQPKQMSDMERIMTGTMPAKEMAAMAMPSKQVPAAEPAMPPKQMAMAAPMPPKQMAMAPGLATYKSDKHGFSLTYPASQFLALPPATPDLFQALSRDGKARLQAGTLANFDGKSLGGYRAFLLDAAYPGAKLGDGPMLAKGFILAGVTSDGTTGFYHRVTFVCGWSNIASWSLQYPAAEQATYAKIIEQVDRDYILGDGNCDRATMTPSAMPMQPSKIGSAETK